MIGESQMSTLWYGGTIYTMEKEREMVEAVLVTNGTIEAVGNLKEIRKSYQNQILEEINLEGNTMFPGFVDSHLHIIGHGEKLLRLDLSEKKSSQEITAAIIEHGKDVKEGDWIIGEGWNENQLPDRKIFHRKELDQLAPQNPVMLTRVCRHAVLANSEALELAGITDTTSDPPGGVIVRDLDGKATGLLLDKAQELVKAVIPKVSEEYIQKALSVAIQDLHRVGLVGGHSEDLNYYGGFNRTLNTYLNVLDERQTKFRAHLLVHHEVVEDMHNSGYKFGEITSFVELGAMKIFADGALGGRTALLSHPYNDAPDTSGVAIHSLDELKELVKKARRFNMSVAIHVIGDLALEYALDAIETFPPSEGKRDRLIHCQVLRPDLIERMKKFPVIADIQPRFVASDFPWVIERLGEERMKNDAYAWRALLQAGIPCAGGSDAPIEDVNPLLGIHAAITRKHPDMTGEGFYLEQQLSMYEAIQLFTSGSAFAICQEHNKGLIKPGYKADFTVFDKDLFEINVDELLTVKVDMTVVDNTIVYKEKR